jgi:hypothetical protein
VNLKPALKPGEQAGEPAKEARRAGFELGTLNFWLPLIAAGKILTHLLRLLTLPSLAARRGKGQRPGLL